MPICSRSVALLLRHLARPRAARTLTTLAATAPPDSAASIRRELGKVKANVEEFREEYLWFYWGIFPCFMSAVLIREWDQYTSIKELKKSIAMLKEKEKAASITAASSFSIPAEPEPEPEPEPAVANGTSCMWGSS